MKRIVGIALGMALGATVVQAGGSIGGFGNGMFYDAASHTLYIPGKLAERLAIMRTGESLETNLIVYPIATEDFAQLKNVADSRHNISAKGDSNTTRSYRVYSGDESSELELIDRRTSIRAGITP